MYTVSKNTLCVSHQQAVEEDMDEHPQAADDQVEQVVEELHVQDHSLVAPRERPSVPHETRQEDDLITHLESSGRHSLFNVRMFRAAC